MIRRSLFSIRGDELLKKPEREQRKILIQAYRYWRRHGFPYYCLTDAQIISSYKALEKSHRRDLWERDQIQLSPVAQALVNIFQPHIWSVPVYKSPTRRFWTPHERFADNRAFKACLARAPRVWPERLIFRASTVRRALMTFPNTAAPVNFRPTAAKAIYERFSSPGDRVLDFSAGYGGRLLGAVAADRSYVGIDPAWRNIRGMRQMICKLRRLNVTRAEPTIFYGCAEEIMPGLTSSSFRLIFSSPPYFSKERYAQNGKQSYLKYPTYEEWKLRFLRPILAESHRLLEANGFLLLNLADVFGLPITRDALDMAKPMFAMERKCSLRLGSLPYTRSEPRSAFKLEPVFVLRKLSTVRSVRQDPRRSETRPS